MTTALPRMTRVVTRQSGRLCSEHCQTRALSCLSPRLSSTGTRRITAASRPGSRAALRGGQKHAPYHTSSLPRAKHMSKTDVKNQRIEWSQQTGLFYDNEYHTSEGDLRLSVLDPTYSTIDRPEVITEVSYPSPKDINAIVSSAQAAQAGPWKDYTTTQRANLLNKLATLIQEHIPTIATIESLNSGKTYAVATTWDVPHTVEVFRYYASLATTIVDERIDRDDGSWIEVVKSPVGVVGAIVPWNYPLAMAAWKLAPALAAGCTVVLKSSEFTPLSMLYVAELIKEAGFPPGVVNVITGDKTVGQAMVKHPDISKIAFTGSTQAGKSIMNDAAETLKPVTLETGGKSPLLVFEDANIDEAVLHAHEGVFQNQGQVCTATGRIFVHNSVLREFMRAFKDVTGRLSVVGDPFDERTFQGPQISGTHQQKITRMIDSARQEQQAVKEIWQPPNPLPTKGFFIPPTIIHLTSPNPLVWKEEIFGPVACVLGFETEDEALRLANDTEYGLAGAVFTRDKGRKRRVALGLQAGTVWVGCNQDCDVRAPFGGWKESGIGRELGVDGLEGYLDKKAVYYSG